MNGAATTSVPHGARRVTTTRPKPVQVLQKARRVLDAFDEENPELGLHRIAAAADLPMSTCFRLLQTLVEEGLLDRQGDRYRPGVRLLHWAAVLVAGRDLITLSHSILERLRDHTAESACLYVRDGIQRSCVALAPTRHSVVRHLYVGKIMPVSAGSGGKIFMAFADDVAEAVFAAGEVPAYTTSTITDVHALRVELSNIRRHGCAVSFEERDAGASSVSAPVFGARGELVAALGLAAPIQRLNPETVTPLVPAVKEAAFALSHALGHRPQGAMAV